MAIWSYSYIIAKALRLVILTINRDNRPIKKKQWLQCSDYNGQSSVITVWFDNNLLRKSLLKRF